MHNNGKILRENIDYCIARGLNYSLNEQVFAIVCQEDDIGAQIIPIGI